MVKMLLQFFLTVPWVTRFSSRSAPGPPHDGVRRARRLNLFHDLADLGSAGSGYSTRSPHPSSSRNDRVSPFGAKALFVFLAPLICLGSRRQCGGLLSKAELGRVGPHAMQDDGELAGDCYPGPRHAAAFGNVHAQGAQARPFLRAHEQRMRRLIEGGVGEFVAAAADLCLGCWSHRTGSAPAAAPDALPPPARSRTTPVGRSWHGR